MGDSAEYGVDIGKCVRPSGWFISFTLNTCEENIVEIWIVDVKLIRANSNYGTV
jgi:hypothetical protein